MGFELVVASKASKGPWMEMYGGHGAEYRVACGIAMHLGIGSVPRFVRRSKRSSGDDGLGRWLAQNTQGLGTTFERILDVRIATPHAATQMANRHRLASVALLWTSAGQQERNLLRQTKARDQTVSCLRFGLHRGERSALYVGSDLGSTPRIDGYGVAEIGRQNSRNRLENQANAARPSVLQCARGGVLASRESAVRDAGDDSRTEAQEEAKGDGTAADQATIRGLVFAHDEEQEEGSHHFGVRGIPTSSKPQRRQTSDTEVVVRCMASAWFPDRDPRAISQAFRYRDELSPNASGEDLHMHSESAPATVVCRNLADPSQSVGLDSPDAALRRYGQGLQSAPRTTTLETDAGLDCPGDRRPITRRFKALRRIATLGRTWNY